VGATRLRSSRDLSCPPPAHFDALQVYAVAAANITMGFTFSGVNSSSLTPAAEEALKEAASDLAGGYSKSLITVSTSPPAAATSSQMEGKVQVQDTPDVVKRGKDLGQPAPALGTANGRRLQQAAEVSWQQGVLEVSGSQHMRQRAAVASALHRRLLQSASAAAAAAPPAAPAASSSSSSGELSVWLLYKHVAPANTSTLLTELCMSCNITPTAAAGTELTSRPCGVEVREALVGAGVGVDDATYSQTLSAPPTVSGPRGALRVLKPASVVWYCIACAGALHSKLLDSAGGQVLSSFPVSAHFVFTDDKSCAKAMHKLALSIHRHAQACATQRCDVLHALPCCLCGPAGVPVSAAGHRHDASTGCGRRRCCAGTVAGTA
jgi:hypothetical protein